MNFFGLFSRSRVQSKLAIAADRIVHRSRQDVWQRVASRVVAMSAAEASGYVRARAAAVIHREVDLAIKDEPRLTQSHRQRLVLLATERVIEAVVEQARSIRPKTMRYSQAA